MVDPGFGDRLPGFRVTLGMRTLRPHLLNCTGARGSVLD